MNPSRLSAALLVGALSVAACSTGGGTDAADARPAAEVAEAAPRPVADPADVESVDAIVTALYDVISGPAGEERDWDRLRSLFIPEGRLTAIARPEGGEARMVRMSVEEYVTQVGPNLEENGFFEREIGRTEERFAGVASLMSAYDSRSTPEGEVFARGVNSIQLLHDGERWWVVSIAWEAEGEDGPIPERFLDG